MNHCIALVAALVVTAVAQAQTTHGYFFGGVGAASSNGYHSAMAGFGFGAELRAVAHLGAGVEVGGLGFTQGYGESLVGVVSPNGYVHLNGSREARVDPYVTGGYSLFFRAGHMNLFNVGGGVNIWPARHIGAKLEFRDHVTTHYSTVHYWGFRIGIALK